MNGGRRIHVVAHDEHGAADVFDRREIAEPHHIVRGVADLELPEILGRLPEPIERLAGNLRRLRAELEAMETRTGVPNKHVRVGALRGAYLDALGTACRRLDISPPPGGDRASQAEIYRVEAALRQRGLDVRQDTRETAAH